MKTYYITHPDEKEKNITRSRAYLLLHREENKTRCKEYLQEHKEKNKANCKAYYLAHREEIRANDRKRRYGLTQISFNVLLESQGGKCAICNRADWNSNGPHVDHDHVSGNVRGILCGNCNAALGYAKESVFTLERMIEYLKRHNLQLEEIHA